MKFAKGYVILLGIVMLLSVTCASDAWASNRVSLTYGQGFFTATEGHGQPGWSAEVYPEFGAVLHFSSIRLGLKAGLLLRPDPSDKWNADPECNCRSYDSISFMPIQGEIMYFPTSGNEGGVASPFVALMLGEYVQIKNKKFDDVDPAVSIRAGLEFSLEPVYLYYDLRFTHAGKFASYYGGFATTIGIGLYL